MMFIAEISKVTGLRAAVEEAIANSLSNLTGLGHATELFNKDEVLAFVSIVLVNTAALNLTDNSEVQLTRTVLTELVKDSAPVASFVGKSIAVELSKHGFTIREAISQLPIHDSIHALFNDVTTGAGNSVEDIFYGLFLLLSTPTLVVTSALLDVKTAFQ